MQSRCSPCAGVTTSSESLSVSIEKFNCLGDQGENSVYIIDGWKIGDRIREDYDEDWNPIGWRSIEPSAEQCEYDFDEMLRAFDGAVPEKLRLGSYLDSIEIPVSEVRLGNEVWMENHELFEVVGFGNREHVRSDLKGVPYVNRNDHDSDYSWNGNNYVRFETCRIQPRG